MRILLLMLLLSFNAVADHVPAGCSPNLTDVDMCEHAVKISADLNKLLPNKTSTMTTASARAVGPTVVFRIEMNTDEADLTQSAKALGITLSALRDDLSSLISETVEDVGCSDEMFVAFVYMGGVYKYQYFYNDGSLFTEVEQRECPE